MIAARALIRALAAAAVLTVAVPAVADHGDGVYPAARGDVVKGFKSLDRLGENVIRFSSAPSRGGRGVVVELAEQSDGGATGGVTFLTGDPESGWKRGEASPLALSAEDWRKLRTAVDAELSAPEPAASRPNGSLLVCDSVTPGYLTERQTEGGVYWLSGHCGPHPNNTIVKLFNALLVEHFASF